MEKKLSSRRIALITASGAVVASSLAPAIVHASVPGPQDTWVSTSDTNYLASDAAHWSTGAIPTSGQTAYFGNHTGLVDPVLSGTASYGYGGAVRFNPGASAGWNVTGAGTFSFGYGPSLIVDSGANSITPALNVTSSGNNFNVATGASIEFKGTFNPSSSSAIVFGGVGGGTAGSFQFDLPGLGTTTGTNYNYMQLGNGGGASPTIILNTNNPLGSTGADTFQAAKFFTTNGAGSTFPTFRAIGSPRTIVNRFSNASYGGGYNFNTVAGDQDLTVQNSFYLYDLNNVNAVVNGAGGTPHAPISVGNAVVTFNGFYAAPGAVATAQQLNKQGAGTLRFTGQLTAGGALPTNINVGTGYSISGGTLLINGTVNDTTATDAQIAAGFGSRTSTVTSAGALGGNATFDFGHAYTHAIAGTLSPGDPAITGGVGKFQFGSSTNSANDLGLSAVTSVLKVDMSGAGGAANAGINYDQVSVFGAIAINGSATLSAGTITPTVNGNYFVLINDGADAITGNFANAPDGGTVTLGGQVFSVTYSGDFATDSAVPLSGNDLVLSIAAPEPASLGLLGLAAGGLLARRRRNKFVC